MKKILSLAFAFVMLCSCFALSASMADTVEGLSNFENAYYSVNEPLSDVPRTIEAVVYFNKRLPVNVTNGAIIGNFRGFSQNPDISLMVDIGGKPKLKFKDGEGEQAILFDNITLFKSEWVHFTLTLDEAKKEAKCYINGELMQTENFVIDISKIGTWDMVVGGDMSFANSNYFKGKLRSLAIYSDVRTEAEIKADMEKVGTSDLILHYDMSALECEHPVTIKDLSKEKNDATLNRILFDEVREPVKDYAYSFAVVGDTQSLAINYPDHFKDIYEYIYDNIESKNIEMVLGLGDITDTEFGENTEAEWKLALDAFKIIDDYVPHIPIRGNHDSMVHYNRYMQEINYVDLIDGRFSDTNYLNTYVDFEVGGIPYLFVVLDYALSEAQLEWACSVVEQFPNHNVIVLRHAYMNHDYRPLQENGEMDPTVLKRGYLSGQATWDDFICKYENIVLTLSGHIGSDLVVTRQIEGNHGNIVTEMLIDFQASDNAIVNRGLSENGLGAVNMFYFSEDGKTLTVETYSTVLDKYYYDINQFTVELDMVTDVKYVKGERTPVPPRGEAKATEIKMTIDSLTASVNGESKTLDAAPIIRNSRTMLPVRFVAENLGATVGWDDATKTVSVKSADATIEIVIGATTAKVNGKEITLDSPAFIENSRTYLPVRVVAENLGATVGWDDATKTATLTK